MVFWIPARLPSLQVHLAAVRSGPSGLPLPSEPWQPVHGAPPTWPAKTCCPSATVAAVAPGGTARVDAAPASLCRPSGGRAWAAAGVPTGGDVVATL